MPISLKLKGFDYDQWHKKGLDDDYDEYDDK